MLVRRVVRKATCINYEVQGNDGYLYLFIDEQTPYIWKKVQIGVKAVGNILQSTQCLPFYESIFTQHLWVHNIISIFNC